jgi:hypothetical protein
MASAGITIRPMSSTGGGGGGGGGAARFAGFFVVVAGLGFGFELPAAGFFAVAAGFAGAVVCANDADASAHAATRAAASFKARDNTASMGADSTRRGTPTHSTNNYQRVSTVRRSVRGSTGWKWRSATGAPSPGNRLS